MLKNILDCKILVINALLIQYSAEEHTLRMDGSPIQKKKEVRLSKRLQELAEVKNLSASLQERGSEFRKKTTWDSSVMRPMSQPLNRYDTNKRQSPNLKEIRETVRQKYWSKTINEPRFLAGHL